MEENNEQPIEETVITDADLKALDDFVIEPVGRYFKKGSYEGQTLTVKIVNVTPNKINPRKLDLEIEIPGEEETKLYPANMTDMNNLKVGFGKPSMWLNRNIKLEMSQAREIDFEDGKKRSVVTSRLTCL